MAKAGGPPQSKKKAVRPELRLTAVTSPLLRLLQLAQKGLGIDRL